MEKEVNDTHIEYSNPCRNTLDDTMVSVGQGDGGDDKAYMEDDAAQLW